MLERMEDFFATRLDGYDAHMLQGIQGATEFYPYTASLLPGTPGAKVLDLGCGTGLELEAYVLLNPQAEITGIDLSERMLEALKEKLPKNRITLIHGSYFDVPLPGNSFDAAVSVESLHHFPAAQKRGLYQKLRAALKETGYFVLTDYFADTDATERACFEALARLKRAEGVDEAVFYHYDTPLTVAHEMELLHQAGFAQVRIMRQWGATYTLVAS